MFNRTQPTGSTEYDAQKFTRMCQDFAEYEILKRTVGTAKATAILLLLYEKWRSLTNAAGTAVKLPAFVTDFPGELKKDLMKEADQIRNRQFYVTGLLKQAKSANLRQRLAAQTRPAVDYSTIASAGGGGTPGGDIRNLGLAYDWIVKSWRGEGKEAVASTLRQHVNRAPGGPPLGFDVAIIEGVWKRVVIPERPYRPPNRETPYPSSVGGRHLLDWMFLQTAGATWPAQGNEQWDDYALFYLGGVGAVQGFADGNKRAARMAYAITLIKARRPFRAPTVKLENDLFQMGAPAGPLVAG